MVHQEAMLSAMPADPLPIEPLDRPPDATVVLPGSKSITNRALVTAALADGVTRLESALFADDTLAMIDGLGALGVKCVPDGADGSITVEGRGPAFADTGFADATESADTGFADTGFADTGFADTGFADAGFADTAFADAAESADAAEFSEAVVNARRSGTTSRFLMPVAALRSTPTVIDGDRQLQARPMGHQISALRELGVSVTELGRPGRLPVRVEGPITGRACSIAGDASSQFASGLLLAGAAAPLSVKLAPDPVSWPYLEMTLAVMGAFGAAVDIAEPVNSSEGKVVTVRGGYRSPGTYRVEPDASTASYFLAAAAITGGRVRIEGLGRRSIQGDVAFADVLAEMGAEVTVGDDSIEVSGGSLHGVEVDLAEISDTAPTLAVVAAFASGATTVSGIGFVRNKESDRLAGAVAELNRCGIDAEETDDGFVVRPSRLPVAAAFETYQDHRMAMAFSLIGLVVKGVSVCDPGCVAKTFPGYFGALEQLR